VWTQLYGQTEALCIMAVLRPEDCVDADGNLIPERFETVGRPSPFTRMAIMDENGALLPPGQKGEIVVQSDLVMDGYYDNPEATAEVSAHGWHHTGDVGAMDEDGFVRILDRTKDMIITGGLNVFPSEVENHLMEHPDVHEVAVIGVPDDKWGEAVKAVIQLRPGATTDESGFIRYCKAHLGSVKSPKSVDFTDRFPKSAVGKLLKKDLRAQYWKDVGRQI
ncbi:MAG: AMP-binding protein, partial [Thalassovita sp.]|nr:AMP-binding protein [Thalassovita sp.]